MSKRNGTLEQLPSGKWRARKKNASGRYVSLGTFDTEQEARLALERPLPQPGAITLLDFGDRYLMRRRDRVSDWKNDEGRWRLYVEPAAIAAVPLVELKRRHVKDWLGELGRKGLAAQTQRNALNILRGALWEALEDELITENPARDVRLPRKARDEDADQKWDVLYPDEQLALLNAVPVEEWHTIAFALGTGVRPSEQWMLELAGINLDERECLVRKGSPEKGPKSGKIRRVPLFGVALDAAREATDRQRRGCPWAFPAPRTNERRALKSHPSGWHDWLRAAGITRRIRFYDLRHTCATSLLAGWWGRKWTLDELAQLLGHGSVKQTERYAHRLNEVLRRAAAGTGFHGTLSESANTRASFEIRTRDLRFTNPRTVSGFSGLAVADFHERSTRRDSRLAFVMLEATRLAYRGNDRLAKARVVELLREGADIVQGEEPRRVG